MSIEQISVPPTTEWVFRRPVPRRRIPLFRFDGGQRRGLWAVNVSRRDDERRWTLHVTLNEWRVPNVCIHVRWFRVMFFYFCRRSGARTARTVYNRRGLGTLKTTFWT